MVLGSLQSNLLLKTTRMHSSRMRTACSSSRHGGFPHSPQSRYPPEQAPPWAGTSSVRSPSTSPLAVGLDQIPPQLPPWLWAWTRSPSISPLAVGLDQIPLNFLLGCGPGNLQGMLGYHTPPGDLLQGMLGYHLQCMLG